LDTCRTQGFCPTSGKIAVDETVAPVLDPGRGRTKKGYFWAIARDDRAWDGTDPPTIAYSYAPGRGAVHALKLLDGYRGVVQCDGYAGLLCGRHDRGALIVCLPQSPASLDGAALGDKLPKHMATTNTTHSLAMRH
jgi:hypothetical protein